MTEDDVRALIAGDETMQVEFKSDRRKLNATELADAVVCLANAQGGTLLLGVEDDGQVTGLHVDHAASRPGHLTGLITSRTVPPVAVETEYVHLSEGTVAVVHVPRMTELTATSDGRLLTRYLEMSGRPGCRPLYPQELAGRAASRGQHDTTDQIVSGTTWDDLDPLEFARFRRMVAENRGDGALADLDDIALARALRLVRSVGNQLVPTFAGLLMMGKESVIREHLPTHEVAFQVLRGPDANVVVNDFYRWPLLRIFERILEALAVRNEEQEFSIGLSRIGVPAYDQRAFREAVNNALVHRDYTRMGAVHIQLRDTGIEIRSPGGFIEGIRPENLLVAGPQPRNPLLADIFKRTGLVERTGRGIGIIYTGQLRAGRLPPDYSRSTPLIVSVILAGGTADLEFVQVLVAEERRHKHRFEVDDLLVLNHLRRERELTASEAGRLTQKGETEARRTLEELVEIGLVERRGTGSTRNYLLSASVYRQLGRPEAYIRRQNFEPIRMEQMILQYVEKYKQIRRPDVMNLCNVTKDQAYYLLKKLVRRGFLQLMGITRSRAYYVLTGSSEAEQPEINEIVSSDEDMKQQYMTLEQDVKRKT